MNIILPSAIVKINDYLTTDSQYVVRRGMFQSGQDSCYIIYLQRVSRTWDLSRDGSLGFAGASWRGLPRYFRRTDRVKRGSAGASDWI